jgi:hypothetical protein
MLNAIMVAKFNKSVMRAATTLVPVVDGDTILTHMTGDRSC